MMSKFFVSCALLVLVSGHVYGSQISATRSAVFAADPTLNNGDVNTEGTVDGADWTFDYASASNFALDNSTSYSPLSATTLFSSSVPNVFGGYHFGFGGVNPYFTHGAGSGTIIGTRLTGVSGGHEDATISGDLQAWTSTTVAGSTININWKLVAFDLLSNSFSLLDSGSVVGTSNGSNNAIMSLAGDLSVNGSTSLQSGDWVGMFYQKAGSSALHTGSHFNINDSGISYSFPVPGPATLLLFLVGGALVLLQRLSSAP